MADDNKSTESEEDGESGKTTPKQLRDNLDKANAENADLRGKLLIFEAGLGHLTEKQRKAVVRDASESGKELTADILKSSAKDLGFPETLASNEDDAGNSGAEGQGSDGGEGDGQPDPTTEALNGMEAIEQARRQTTQAPGNNSFAEKMARAASQAEVEALIRSEGAKVGLVHEWDVE